MYCCFASFSLLGEEVKGSAGDGSDIEERREGVDICLVLGAIAQK